MTYHAAKVYQDVYFDKYLQYWETLQVKVIDIVDMHCSYVLYTNVSYKEPFLRQSIKLDLNYKIGYTLNEHGSDSLQILSSSSLSKIRD
jgi:hypothetical protein